MKTQTTIGFKIYARQDNELYPLLSPVQRPYKAEAKAVCHILSALPTNHQAPAANCSCGFSAFYNLEDTFHYLYVLEKNSKNSKEDYVIALVEAKGKTIKEELFWRAEETEIISIPNQKFLNAKIKSFKNLSEAEKEIALVFAEKQAKALSAKKAEQILRKQARTKKRFFFNFKKVKQESSFEINSKRSKAEFEKAINDYSNQQEAFYETRKSQFLSKQNQSSKNPSKENQKEFPFAALGFRTWRDSDSLLYPVVKKDDPLLPGENIAKCNFLPNPFHFQLNSLPPTGPCKNAPAENHSCGFYAYHSFSNAQSSPYSSLFHVNIVGAVAGSGQMQIHSHGWRAEKLQVLALFSKNKPWISTPFFYNNYSKEIKIARNYQIAVFSDSELFSIYLKQYARSIPEQAIPKDFFPTSEQAILHEYLKKFKSVKASIQRNRSKQ